MICNDPAWNWVFDSVAEQKTRGLWRELRERNGPCGATITVNSQRLLNFGGNDYLGLACDQRLSDAAAQAAAAEGWGGGASPVVCGRSTAHARLEKELAQRLVGEAALCFSSGYAANMGVISALVGRDDSIFSDAANHASIIDGCRLSRANVYIYDHLNFQSLEEKLQAAPSEGKRLIVSDSIFSMDGDTADVPELLEIAQKHGAMLLLDEAHAFGVMGVHGGGVAELKGASDSVLRIGTLSKAFGASGGFVLGPKSIIEWCYNKARSYFFSTSHPPAAAAAALEGLRIACDETWRRESLLTQAVWLRNELSQQGWSIPAGTSPIVPVLLGENARTLRIAEQLKDRGFFAPGIRPPSVAAGQARLRISLSYANSSQDVQSLANAMAELIGS